MVPSFVGFCVGEREQAMISAHVEDRSCMRASRRVGAVGPLPAAWAGDGARSGWDRRRVWESRSVSAEIVEPLQMSIIDLGLLPRQGFFTPQVTP